ncbi:MAG: acyl-CoA thioesterase/BAAT N-terminal domain-containing protein [Armatimonadetes bacterium]|nr:acyl-CoA thioesterase/BAAT N-terminal domain-containing protein [Armatimonadota bacterium]
MMASVRMDAEPRKALADEKVHIKLTGLAPGQRVTVRARARDHAGQVWESNAAFAADGGGNVDVSAQAPIGGTYGAVDATGLFWSMVPQVEGKDPAPFALTSVTPITVALSAEVEGKQAAAADVERWLAAPGVTRTDVREDGLVSVFFQPTGRGPHPAVLVLGGSGGALRWSEQVAALLASRGCAALALAYFDMEHLPPNLVEIPLDYFAPALQWLRARPDVTPGKTAVVGASKGGELALLLGATYPEITAVVAYVPSNVVHEGITRGADGRAGKSSWAYRGEPLPFLPRRPGGEIRREVPVALTPVYLDALRNQDPGIVEWAAIPVERIRGPVLLISGHDDQLWPSPVFSELVIKRLSERRHPYPFRHLCYENAGHSVGPPPYLPTTVTQSRHPIRDIVLLSGGDTRGNATAKAQGWAEVLRFLGEHFGR